MPQCLSIRDWSLGFDVTHLGGDGGGPRSGAVRMAKRTGPPVRGVDGWAHPGKPRVRPVGVISRERHASSTERACSSDRNRVSLSNSSRKRPMNIPGAPRNAKRPGDHPPAAGWHSRSVRSSSRATRMPEIGVSGTSDKHLRMQSSTTIRMRIRRPSMNSSTTKSNDQRSLQPA